MGVVLIALKSYTYRGRALRAGDRFSATPHDARLLKQLRRASDAPLGLVTPTAMEVVPVVAEPIVAFGAAASKSSIVFESNFVTPPEDVGNGQIADEPPVPEPDPDPEPEADPEPEPPAAAEPMSTDMKPRLRRRYSRKDLQADES